MTKSLTKSMRTRARVLDAAAEVLSKNGYVGFRLSDVAEAADLQAPAIYYHFASREELIEEVIETGQNRVMEHVARALATAPDEPPIDRILIAVAAHLECILTMSRYASASTRNFRQIPQDMRDRQMVLRRRYGTLWRELFDQAALASSLDSRLDVHAARMFTLGALNWTTEWWDTGRGELSTIITVAQDFIGSAITGRQSQPTVTSSPTARKPRKPATIQTA
jgi:AcrR family transcriptional regulator